MSKPNEQVEQSNEQVEQDEEESLNLDVKRVKSLQTSVKGGSAWSGQSCPV